jgi:hypothetical protein
MTMILDKNTVARAENFILYYRIHTKEKNIMWGMEGKMVHLIAVEPNFRMSKVDFVHTYHGFVPLDNCVKIIRGVYESNSKRCAWIDYKTEDLSVENARSRYMSYAEYSVKYGGHRMTLVVPHNYQFI